MFAPRILKKIAIVTVFVFAWMNLVANYGHAQQGTDPLSQAQELYKNERYDAAVQLLQKFVEHNRGLAGQNGRVASAYYLLAKIYYELREDKKMGEMLESLFSLSPQYSQEESNEGFKKVVGKYQGGLTITASGSGSPSIVEKQVKDPGKPTIKKKKKFPILLVIGGIIIVGLVVYLLLNKPKYTLTVNKGGGVSGGPESGAYEYKKGTAVTYGYSLQSGYKNLLVLLDGQSIGSSGTITMNANHSLTIAAEQKVSYSLNVTKGTGVAGTPETGTYWWEEGQTASYSYSLQTNYKNLVVKLDNVLVANSGTIAMSGSHNLDVSATYDDPNIMYKLVVNTTFAGALVSSNPSAGTYYYKKGTIINYSYTVGINEELHVFIDYVDICDNASHTSYVTCNGAISMDKDRYLEVQTGPYY